METSATTAAMMTQLIKVWGPAVAKKYFGKISGFTLQQSLFSEYEAWRELLLPTRRHGTTDVMLATTTSRDLIQKSLLLILQYFNVYFTQHEENSKKIVVRLMSDSSVGLVKNNQFQTFGQFYARELMVDIIACAVVSAMQTRAPSWKFWLGRVTVVSQPAHVLNMLQLRLLRHMACCLELVGRESFDRPMLASSMRTALLFERSFVWDMTLADDPVIAWHGPELRAERTGNRTTMPSPSSLAIEDYRRFDQIYDKIAATKTDYECQGYAEMLSRWEKLTSDWRTTTWDSLTRFPTPKPKDEFIQYRVITLEFLTQCNKVKSDGTVNLRLTNEVQQSIMVAGRVLGLLMSRRGVPVSSDQPTRGLLQSCAFTVMSSFSAFVVEDRKWGRYEPVFCCGLV